MPNKFIDRIKFDKRKFSVNVTLIGYQEDDNFVFFSPALDLYAYGDNQDEAYNAFDETIHLYIDHVLSEHTLEKDLKRLGWKRHAHFNKRFLPPKYDPRDLMSKKGVTSFNVIDKQLALSS